MSDPIVCPRCGFEQPASEECGRCGVIIAKARHLPAISPATADDEPRGKERLVGLLSAVLVVGLSAFGVVTLRSQDEERQPAPAQVPERRTAPKRAVAGNSPPQEQAMPAFPATSDEEQTGQAVTVALDSDADSGPLTRTAPELRPSLGDSWREGARGYEEAEAERRRLGVPMAVYFYTTWCGYCRKLDAQILPQPEVQDVLGSLVKVRIDPESGREEAALAHRFGVDGFPSFFVMPASGSSPQRVHPFQARGNTPIQMSGAEFAAACSRAAGLR